MAPMCGGTGVWEVKKFGSHQLYNVAEREVLNAVLRALPVAKATSALSLESAKSRPPIEKGILEDDCHPRRGMIPGPPEHSQSPCWSMANRYVKLPSLQSTPEKREN